MARETSFDRRYGVLLRRDGIATVPAALYHYQAALGLSVAETWLITAILTYRWTDEAPYPALTTIARQAGLSERVVRKYVADLRAKGLIDVEARFDPKGYQTSSAYDFDPLFDRLEQCILRDVENQALNKRAPRPAPPFTPSPEPAFRPALNERADETDPGETDSTEEEIVSLSRHILHELHRTPAPHARASVAEKLAALLDGDNADWARVRLAVNRALALAGQSGDESEFWRMLTRVLAMEGQNVVDDNR